MTGSFPEGAAVCDVAVTAETGEGERLNSNASVGIRIFVPRPPGWKLGNCRALIRRRIVAAESPLIWTYSSIDKYLRRDPTSPSAGPAGLSRMDGNAWAACGPNMWGVTI